MIPDCRDGIVDLRVVKDVVAAVAVVVVFRQRNVVDGKGEAVFSGHIGIQTAIVLCSGKLGGVDGVVVRNVGHVAQGTARSPTARARSNDPGLVELASVVLRTQARCEGRADVQALTWNRSAIDSFRKTGGCASGGSIEGANYTVTGEGKIFRGDASRRGQSLESRGIVPTVALQLVTGSRTVS